MRGASFTRSSSGSSSKRFWIRAWLSRDGGSKAPRHDWPESSPGRPDESGLALPASGSRLGQDARTEREDVQDRVGPERARKGGSGRNVELDRSQVSSRVGQGTRRVPVV